MKSIAFIVCLLFLIMCVSAIPSYCNSNLPGGQNCIVTGGGNINVTNYYNNTYYNNTYIGASVVNLNTTQFYNNTAVDFSINSSFLSIFINTFHYITSWLIPDTTNGYLYNESSKIYFNETRLINAGFNSTYNATYDKWAYNQTTTVTGGSYNSTYAIWAYNQTYSGSTYNSTYAGYGIWAYNQTGGGSGSSYNATYAQWSYNQTYSGSIYNATYNQWAYNQSGTGGATASIGYFVSYTPITVTGNVINGTLNGYPAGNAICNSYFAGTHVCQAGEVLNSINAGRANTNFTATFWVTQLNPGYLANANDCNGMTSASGGDLGAIMVGSTSATNTYGSGSLVSCSASRALGCCR